MNFPHSYKHTQKNLKNCRWKETKLLRANQYTSGLSPQIYDENLKEIKKEKMKYKYLNKPQLKFDIFKT